MPVKNPPKYKRDEFGYVDAKQKPKPYELITLQTDKGKFSAWWTNNDWYGYRLPKEAKAIKWKNQPTHINN